jgi:hypothetical protein
MEKYIFLDIDGVMVNYDAMILPHLGDNYAQFSVESVNTLNDIIEKTNANIVISSSWRNNLGDDEANLKWIRDIFIKRGFKHPKKIIGQTVRGYQYVIKGSNLPIVRGNEIKQWVDTHLKYPWHAYPEKKKEFQIYKDDGSFKRMRSNKKDIDYQIIILDDDTDFLLEHKNDFIQTYCDTGLTKEIGEIIINKFK